MSRYRYEMGGIIRDTEIDFPYPTDEIIELLDEKDKKIADLEEKLAESEKELNQRKEMFIALQEQCAKDIKEKEIEIHCWKCSAKDWKQHHEKLLDDLVRITNKVDQDKISFAVEQLVNIQKYISDNAVYVEEESFGREINEYIDNQIKQLKEMK